MRYVDCVNTGSIRRAWGACVPRWRHLASCARTNKSSWAGSRAERSKHGPSWTPLCILCFVTCCSRLLTQVHQATFVVWHEGTQQFRCITVSSYFAVLPLKGHTTHCCSSVLCGRNAPAPCLLHCLLTRYLQTLCTGVELFAQCGTRLSDLCVQSSCLSDFKSMVPHSSVNVDNRLGPLHWCSWCSSVTCLCCLDTSL